MGDTVERRRREQDRMGEIEPEQTRARVARGDVDERAIAQRAPRERGAVAGDGALVLAPPAMKS